MVKSLIKDHKLDCEKKPRSRAKSIASPRNLGARWPAQRSLDLYAVRATYGATAAGEQRAVVEGGEDGRTEGGRGEGLGEWSEWPRAALIGIIKPKLLPSNPGEQREREREAQQVSGALDVCVVRPWCSLGEEGESGSHGAEKIPTGERDGQGNVFGGPTSQARNCARLFVVGVA